MMTDFLKEVGTTEVARDSLNQMVFNEGRDNSITHRLNFGTIKLSNAFNPSSAEGLLNNVCAHHTPATYDCLFIR